MLAQLAPAAPESLGTWLIAFAAVVVIGGAILKAVVDYRSLTARPRKRIVAPDARYITRAELDIAVVAVKAEVARVEKALGERFGKHEDYTHTRLHEIANSLQAVLNRLAVIQTRMEVAHVVSPKENPE